MEIVWYGHSCFRLKTRGAIVVTDPCGKDVGYNVPRLRADIVTISHNHPDYNNCALVQGDPKIIAGPGEYEIKGVFITGIATYLKKAKGPTLFAPRPGGEIQPASRREKQPGPAAQVSKVEGSQRPKNTIYLFTFDGLNVCHLGALDHVPSQALLEPLSDIDVLLIPVGAFTTMNANQAAEMIGLLEPKIVIPMHYKTKATKLKLEPVSKFIKEMGLPETSPRGSLEVDKNSLPSETQIVLLNYKE